MSGVMNGKSGSQAKSTTPPPTFSLSQPGILQRKCDCGGVAGLTGQCEECNSKRLSGQRRVSNPPPDGDEVSQRTGMTAMEQLPGHSFGRMSVQAKLAIGAPGDKYEQEADRVADQVMRMPDPVVRNTKFIDTIQRFPSIQGLCTDCPEKIQRTTRQPFSISEGKIVPPQEEEEGRIQTKQSSSDTPEMTPKIEAQINDTLHNSSGQPLPTSVRAFMEPRFSYNFSQVRIHTDASAAKMAKALKARAFTLDQHLVFGAGQYAPTTDNGRRLLAHELTHAVQQGKALPTSQESQGISNQHHNNALANFVSRESLSSHSRETGKLFGHTIASFSEDMNTIRRVAWTPNVDTGNDVAPWGDAITGDVLTAATDTGTAINTWSPHDGATYWCHGYTFGGSAAHGGPYSVWGNTVTTILNDDGWQLTRSCLARPNDILVFYAGGGVAHTGIITSRVDQAANMGVVDEQASMVRSKWGQQALNTSSWQNNANQYGNYRCFSRSPLVGPCRDSGAHEL